MFIAAFASRKVDKGNIYRNTCCKYHASFEARGSKIYLTTTALQMMAKKDMFSWINPLSFWTISLTSDICSYVYIYV